MAQPQQRIYQITAQYLEQIKAEREHLLAVEIEENKEALAAARALGDLSENSEYTSARENQRKLLDRLELIEYIIKYHEIIAEEWVTIEYIDLGKTEKYQIVGVLEADPDKNKISTSSPVGKAIQGRKEGDVVSFTSGSGRKLNIKIVNKGIK